MKKTTILIYQDATCPRKGLRIATPEEWTAILTENKGQPMSERRCFIEDSFEDSGVIDRMFIEVSYSQYLEWHRQRVEEMRNREEGKQYLHISLDCKVGHSGDLTMIDILEYNSSLEDAAVEEITMGQLRAALSEWRPWANELLDFYISGQKKQCAKIICDREGLSPQTLSQRKMAFERFVADFYAIKKISNRGVKN